ncbi:MAG: PPC domain-containing DNA-binding protein [Candidatus Sumerlaeota bacterium]
MQYQEAKAGRTFVARLKDGEDIYACIESIAERENIEAASVYAIGGIRKGGVVVGPQDPASLKDIEGIVRNFDDAREILGVGTIFPRDGKPALHFHGAMGREDNTLVGCPRKEATCFLTLEVVIVEWTGLEAERKPDPESGFALLDMPNARKVGE